MTNLNRFAALLLLFVALSVSANPRPRYKDRLKAARDTSLVKAYTDSLYLTKARLFSTDSLYTNSSEYDNRMTFLFLPTTFYSSVVRNMLSSNSARRDDIQSLIDGTLMNIYLNKPYLVAKDEKEISKMGDVHKEISNVIKKKERLADKADDIFEDKSDFEIPVEILVEKPNFWKYSGDYYLQMLQNYVSSNWYKGGESNYSMVASVTMQANYNNKQKVKFDNKLEMKLGFQTSRGDTVHSFKTSEDLIRYTGKLGLQASKKWYYSLQLLAYTQFTRGYKSNDHTVYSDILSPLNVNISVGMDYSVSWFNKKLTGTIQMAPLAYNFKYVGRRALATRYGLDEGKHTLNDFGSDCTIDLTWAITNAIKWKTRLYGYTTYKRAEMEWENTFSFQFNKYITSNIFVYPRFDDGANRDDDHGYWQLKEYASIGFAYSF